MGSAVSGVQLDGVEDAVVEFAGEVADGEELQVDGAAVAIAVADLGDAGADDGGDAEFFVEFAGEGLLGGFAEFDLAAGELPLEAHGLVGTALADQDFGGAAVLDGSSRRIRAATTSRIGLPFALPCPSSLRMRSFTRGLFLRLRCQRQGNKLNLSSLDEPGTGFARDSTAKCVTRAAVGRDAHAVEPGAGLGGFGASWGSAG